MLPDAFEQERRPPATFALALPAGVLLVQDEYLGAGQFVLTVGTLHNPAFARSAFA